MNSFPLESGASVHSVKRPFNALAAYLTGTAGGAFLLTAPQADAAVTAVTFGFGPVLSGASDFSSVASTTPNLGSIFAEGSSYYYYGIQTTVRLGGQFSGWNQGTVYQQRSSYGVATFLSDGTVVGGGGNGVLGMAYFAAERAMLNFTTDQLNQNIGFQTNTGNWGWATVSWDATEKALTFHSAYIESISGNTITVGDIGAVPEPSRALLALAGLGGVALRRRRKQRA